MLTVLLLVAGLLLLYKGGDFLVDGAKAIALRYGISPQVVGLTVVGFGTSAPELLVSLQAVWAGQSGIALGNVLGSNTANILLILGAGAVTGSIALHANKLARDLAFMVGSTMLLWLFMLDGTVGRLNGLVLVSVLCGFLWISLKSKTAQLDALPSELMPAAKAWAMTAVGLVALVLGADWLVSSATTIATALGVSNAVIGLTVVAVGTSLPELATSVRAVSKGETDIAVGNVIGSNIFNIAGILGITSVLMPLTVDGRFLSQDIVWVAITAIGITVIAVTVGKLTKSIGIAMLSVYAIYVLSALVI
jgi:cation:H+ antiporter